MKKLIKYRNKKYSIYICLFFIVLSSFVLYIDNIFFYNAKKIALCFNQDIEFISFKKIIQTIKIDNQLNSTLLIYNNIPFLHIDGFKDEPLVYSNKKILKRKSIHPTQQLSLYSLAYATDFFKGKSHGLKLKRNDFMLLKSIYLFVNSEILNFFSLNYATINDHAISERVEFLILFLSYLEEYEPNETTLVRLLQKDLKICVGFLSNDNQFTWQTNHGIMQLRAIAQIANYTKDIELRKKLIKIFESRIPLIISYHIGDDGAIYESASGYWKYIYHQFNKISKIEIVRHLAVSKILSEKLKQSSKFMEIVTTNDGFLQGLGDSYSSFDLNRIIDKSNNIPTNRCFWFSNQLAGLNWTTDSINSSILFVSLDTPPNVHKLPEDLAIYIYSNGPFFANTGIYAYGKSKIRSSFEHEDSQSTIRIQNSTNAKLIKSFIFKAKFGLINENIIIGKKIYQNSDTITRVLKINNNQTFQLIDTSTSTMNNSLECSFNLHPDVTYKLINDTTILLINKNCISLKLISNNKIWLSKTIISDSYNHFVAVERVNINGKKICNRFTLLNSTATQSSIINLKNIGNYGENSRLQASRKLVEKYGLSNNRYKSSKVILMNALILTVCLYLIFVLFLEIYFNKYKKTQNVKN